MRVIKSRMRLADLEEEETCLQYSGCKALREENTRKTYAQVGIILKCILGEVGLGCGLDLYGSG
jgi:hypothetical protein